jgi:hypothetical protein
MESEEENEYESEQERSNSDDGNALESEQEKQSGTVRACTNSVGVDVKKALKSLQWTQKDLSKYLDISQPKISLWLNKRAGTEPETILTQMISFLEAEEMNIRTKTNTGSSTEHSTGRKDSGSPNNSKCESQLTTAQLPGYPIQGQRPHHHQRRLQHRTRCGCLC